MEELSLNIQVDGDVQTPEPYGFICGVLCSSGILC